MYKFLQIGYVYIVVYNVMRQMRFFERISSYRFLFSSRESCIGLVLLYLKFSLMEASKCTYQALFGLKFDISQFFFKEDVRRYVRLSRVLQ